jgi:hypothetical protein
VFGSVYERSLELRTAFGSVVVRRIVEMAVTEHVKLERKDGLLVLTLANPDGNRIGLGVLAGLRAALVELKRPETRAVLLKGEGPVFSYGADLKEFLTRPPAELLALMQEYLDILGQSIRFGPPPEPRSAFLKQILLPLHWQVACSASRHAPGAHGHSR